MLCWFLQLIAEKNENIIEKPTKPPNFFRRNILSLLPCLLRGKRFWRRIFPSDVVPFLSKGDGHLFAPWNDNAGEWV